MLTLAALLIGLEALDMALTAWAVSLGYTEANRLVAPIVGTWLWPALKIIPTVVVAVGIVYVSRWLLEAQRMAVIAGLAAANVFLAIVLALNIAQLIR